MQQKLNQARGRRGISWGLSLIGAAGLLGVVLWAAFGRTAGTAAAPKILGPIQGELLSSAVPERSAPSASSTEPSPATAQVFKDKKNDEYTAVTFGLLNSYNFKDPTEAELKDPVRNRPNQIPDSVMAYNGKKAQIAGFMLPVEIDSKSKVTSFVLLESQLGCCFGIPPPTNGWVLVDLPNGVKYAPDIPIIAFGTLEMGEEYKDGELESLYRLAGDKVLIMEHSAAIQSGQ